MEAIASITKATATQFQMQEATNCSRPLPFPTVTEAAKIKHVYEMAAHRGRPSVPTLNTLVREMGIEMKDIKGWFADKRKAQGHEGHGWATQKEPAPSVEVRAHLPVPTSGARPSASFVCRGGGGRVHGGRDEGGR